jgi:hypothetical protein
MTEASRRNERTCQGCYGLQRELNGKRDTGHAQSVPEVSYIIKNYLYDVLASQFTAEPTPAKPANAVITDPGAESTAKTTAAPEPQPGRSPSASACAPYREAVELGLSRGRNALAIWQDLVDTCGFSAGYQSVRRFVSTLHPPQSPEARAVIETAPGEEFSSRLRRRPDGTRLAHW